MGNKKETGEVSQRKGKGRRGKRRTTMMKK